jgi:hypothetical protein
MLFKASPRPQSSQLRLVFELPGANPLPKEYTHHFGYYARTYPEP